MTPRAVVRPVSWRPGQRVLVVSDIHGALPLLKGALAKAGFGRDDVLIVLGDMLERSEGSLDTLRYVMELSRTHTVHTVLGNCDNITPAFFRRQTDRSPQIPDAFYQRWFARHGARCTLVKMARTVGVSLDSPQDYPAARAALEAHYGPELAFLRGLPHILVNDGYLFVHGGVPRETELERLSAFDVMKNDDFLNQGHSFRRWVVVGHWPVTLYHRRVPSAAPIFDRARHIASIDGGATLKLDGQVNVVALPQGPGGDFAWVSEDGLPTVTALDAQPPSQDSVNVRFGHSALEILEEGEEFCLCRHLETGRTLPVLTEYLRRRDGQVTCEDSTDCRLAVSPGDALSVVRETSRGLLAKKDGVTGWYGGRYRSAEPSRHQD